MSKLQLPTVTLCLIDCLNVGRSIKVIEHCKSLCDFGAVKFLTSLETNYRHKVEIMPLNSLIAYSIFCLTRLHEYIDTEMVQIIQRDGWILNASVWNDEWLGMDYVAPLFMQYDHCGSGGFSLRSKRIMEAASKEVPEWDGTDAHAHELQKNIPYYEDGMLSLSPFSKKFNIASREVACMYGQGGNRNKKYLVDKVWGFHRTWQRVDFINGVIDSSDPTRDLAASYDLEIDKYL